MALTRPSLDTLTNTGGINRLLQEKIDVYFSEGSIPVADIPTDQTELRALYGDAAEKFVPLGRLAAEAGSITTEPVTGEIHGDTITLRYKVNMELNSVEVHKDMLDYLESKKDDEFSFLFLSRSEVKADDPTRFFIVSGVQLQPAINVSINGDFATIAITSVSEADKVSDILKYNEDLA